MPWPPIIGSTFCRQPRVLEPHMSDSTQQQAGQQEGPSQAGTWDAQRWQDIDTVLLDMDGTLIDLNYDNQFWNDLLPARYASTHGLSRSEADSAFSAYVGEVHGSLSYYCIDAWARFARLPVRELMEELRHLHSFRPHSETLLRRLHAAGKDVRIVTNAHPASIDLKHRVFGIRDRVAHFYSAHDLGHPKESADFWHALAQQHPFVAQRTLLIDDTEAVLDAGRAHGIAWTLAVTSPDSRRAARVPARHPGVDNFEALFTGLPPT